MKKERLLEISYGRVDAIHCLCLSLAANTSPGTYTRNHNGPNQHMHYVLEEFSRRRERDTRRCYIFDVLELDAFSQYGQPIDHTN